MDKIGTKNKIDNMDKMDNMDKLIIWTYGQN